MKTTGGGSVGEELLIFEESSRVDAVGSLHPLAAATVAPAAAPPSHDCSDDPATVAAMPTLSTAPSSAIASSPVCLMSFSPADTSVGVGPVPGADGSTFSGGASGAQRGMGVFVGSGAPSREYIRTISLPDGGSRTNCTRI